MNYHHALASLDQTLRPTDISVLNHLLSDKIARNVLPGTDHFAVIYSATLKGQQTRIDIVFDDYRILSIKSGTREQRNAYILLINLTLNYL